MAISDSLKKLIFLKISDQASLMTQTNMAAILLILCVCVWGGGGGIVQYHENWKKKNPHSQRNNLTQIADHHYKHTTEIVKFLLWGYNRQNSILPLPHAKDINLC